MYLPKPYEAFSEKHPELIKQYQELGKACREAGSLDAKSQELVNLSKSTVDILLRRLYTFCR